MFDLDGTLIDSERQNAESVARVLLRHGRALTEEERAFVVGHGWHEIYDHLVEAGGVELSFDDLKAAAAFEREHLMAVEGVDVLPGAVDAVRHFASRAPTTIVSGSSRIEIASCLRALRLEETISWYVGAEDTRRGKPSPDGYLLAAAHLGQPPDRTLVFEDSTAGIRAARAAGMVVVGLRAGNFAGQAQDEAHAVVDSFLEVDDALLARLFEGRR
jgi:HAD superfamily hydrolase (TIGR01509 family)